MGRPLGEKGGDAPSALLSVAAAHSGRTQRLPRVRMGKQSGALTRALCCAKENEAESARRENECDLLSEHQSLDPELESPQAPACEVIRFPELRQHFGMHGPFASPADGSGRCLSASCVPPLCSLTALSSWRSWLPSSTPLFALQEPFALFGPAAKPRPLWP
jgi:hypothetical protein